MLRQPDCRLRVARVWSCPGRALVPPPPSNPGTPVPPWARGTRTPAHRARSCIPSRTDHPDKTHWSQTVPTQLTWETPAPQLVRSEEPRRGRSLRGALWRGWTHSSQPRGLLLGPGCAWSWWERLGKEVVSLSWLGGRLPCPQKWRCEEPRPGQPLGSQGSLGGDAAEPECRRPLGFLLGGRLQGEGAPPQRFPSLGPLTHTHAQGPVPASSATLARLVCLAQPCQRTSSRSALAPQATEGGRQPVTTWASRVDTQRGRPAVARKGRRVRAVLGLGSGGQAALRPELQAPGLPSAELRSRRRAVLPRPLTGAPCGAPWGGCVRCRGPAGRLLVTASPRGRSRTAGTQKPLWWPVNAS